MAYHINIHQSAERVIILDFHAQVFGLLLAAVGEEEGFKTCREIVNSHFSHSPAETAAKFGHTLHADVVALGSAFHIPGNVDCEHHKGQVGMTVKQTQLRGASGIAGRKQEIECNHVSLRYF